MKTKDALNGETPYAMDVVTDIDRGFTDHEHLDDAELIHMNGRVYDYNLGRFLSVDPFIQAPGNSQSMNPYSYIMNNPLAGTDPSGYKSICGKDGLRSCDAVIYPNGNTSSVGSAESNNGKDTNATLYVIHKSDQKIESLGDIKSEDVLGIAIVDDSHADFTDYVLADAISGGTRFDINVAPENLIAFACGR